jgi:spermidine synthase
MAYLIFGLFFLSGACGLVYEIVWSRELVLVTGGATNAMTATVTSFMGGLALGGFWGGRLIDRRKINPVLAYGLLEAGIGLFALATPHLISLSRAPLSALYVALQDQLGLFSLLRFVITALLVLPPTILMGATLPVLFRGLLERREQFGRTAGRLYTANTLGAMLGAGLAGFVLLPALGNHATAGLAAATNFLIAGAAAAMHRRFSTPPAATPPNAPATGWTVRAKLVLAGYGLSGMAALIYQIAWTRSLTLSLGGTTRAFTLILVAYIGGLGLGSGAMTGRADRIQRPLFVAGLMEIAIGLSALAVLPLLDNVNLLMMEATIRFNEHAGRLGLAQLVGAFGLIAVPTMLMGALLPLISRAMARERPGVAEPMGLVYAANTVGAIAGAVLIAFVLINYLGVRNSILVAAAGSVGVGGLWLAAGEVRRSVAWAGTGAAVLAGAAAIALLPRPDLLLLNSGPYYYAEQYRQHLGGRGLADFIHRSYKLLSFQEDTEVTVSVLEERKAPSRRQLRINGKVDATDWTDMPTQIMLAHLPLLLHPRPERVLIIGLGSGMTSGAALTHPLRSLDCFELSPAVARASVFFDPVNQLHRSDPRYHLTINDGRNHLTLSPSRYDVIISEPSNPWQAGQGLLFTKEYFQLMRGHLSDDGLAVAWIGIYDLGPEEVKMVLRTFSAVFPYVSVWETLYDADFILLGSKKPLVIDYAALQEKLRRPAVAANIGRIGIEDADQVLSIFIMDQDQVRAIVGPGPWCSDDRRQLEFSPPRVFGDRHRQEINRQVLSHHRDATHLVDFGQDPQAPAVIRRLQDFDRERNYPLP